MMRRGPPPPIPVITSWIPILVAATLGSVVFVVALGVAAWWTRHASPRPPAPAVDDAGRAPALALADGGGDTSAIDGGAAAPVPPLQSVDVDAAARAFVEARHDALAACVKDARRRDPEATERATLGVVVDADGAVTALDVAISPSPYFTTCVTRAFPLPLPGPGVRVTRVGIAMRDGRLVVERAP